MNTASAAVKRRTKAPTRTLFERVSTSCSSRRQRRSVSRFGSRPPQHGPRPVEIILYPRMLGGKQFGDGSDRNHLLFREHGDTVAGRVKSVEIVGDEKDGEAHRIGQLADQFVELGGADRVEPRGRLVEEEQRGVERERARSEEHTSELQSLMRISYAVFCWEKKKEKSTIM